MMRMRRTTICGVLGLCVAASLAVAQPAERPGKDGPGGRGRFMAGRMARFLNLSDDQKTAFQKALEQQRPQMQALHQQMRDVRQKLDDALKADNPDPAVVGQLTIQDRALIKQGHALHDQLAQTLRGLLTPEQQTKFDAMQSLGRGFGPVAGPGPARFGRRGGWGQGQQPAPPEP
jgi:Spy/CpxP family protein refolding chaperone